MPITLNMLLEHLGDRVIKAPTANGTARFSHIALITFDDETDYAARCKRCNIDCPERTSPTMQEDNLGQKTDSDVSSTDTGLYDRDKIEQETLYCGMEDSALHLTSSCPDVFALGIVPKEEAHKARSSYPEQLILICDDRSLATVYEEIRQFALIYEQWIDRMRDVLFKNGSYQDLLDASTDVFQDFIAITDSAFRLLGYTKNAALDDPVAQGLVERGYHSKETIDNFKRYRLTNQWRSQTGIMRDTHVAKHPTLGYVLRMHGSYFVHVVLQCTASGEVSDALFDIFKMFTEQLELYIDHDRTLQRYPTKNYAPLLSDLVIGQAPDHERLLGFLEQLDIKYESAYMLCVSEIEEKGDEEEGRSMIGYYAWRLAEFIPSGRTFVLQNRLFLLAEFTNDKDNAEEGSSAKSGMNMRRVVRKGTNDLYEQLCSYQKAYGGTIGMSEAFTCIEDLPFAYSQARYAIECGTHEPKTLAQQLEVTSETCHVHQFATYLSSYIYEHVGQDTKMTDYWAQHSVLVDIMAYDRKHGTNDTRILYWYLQCERRANEAAEKLYMHRNTLMYRIQKLQERFNIDLADREERERLLLTYHLMHK